MMVAMSRSPGSTWSMLDARYAGREVTSGQGTDVAIVHDSAHEQSNLFRRMNRRLKTLRRSILGRGTTRALTGR